MTQPANNLRVRRTQKLLREALIELIEEHGFDTITVGEITGRAMVSRASFYRNYKDKYDLVEQVFEEAIQALRDFVSMPGAEHPTIWVHFFEHVVEYEQLYRALLGRNGSPWFVLKMRSALQTMIREFEQLINSNPQVYQPVLHAKPAGDGFPPASEKKVSVQQKNPPGLLTCDPFVEDLVASMLVETITWWLEQGKPCTTRQIADRCSSLIGAVFREASTWK